MNTRADTAATPYTPAQQQGTSLPAGAGIALAVAVGSLMWIGIFALMM
ncbi:hypothetical protein [Pararhodobacter zhoushanensis]|uniref:Uncharacterized protein n=1 Tax=Pararhodobacter zhoushanensis TaxID=2479545 RepID=A0ABT3GUP3_9RHOB|nr:hypothetical protein [Pararhodobacter zhoushanensis]MCW1931234.1 hypothetical protein [Pararhodobacter zhoushanensis]